jgi:energy-coupling factor transporter ATP-binding protein EcfA2
MSENYRFPPELLEAPVEQRLAFFKNPGKTIMHRNLKQAFTDTYRLVRNHAGSTLILVIGPSGVGKSTLLALLRRKILEVSLPQMEFDLGWYPIICIEAPAIKAGFRWKPFYKEILLAVDEPCIENKIIYDEDCFRRNKNGKLIVPSRATEDSLRLAARKVCLYRKPYTIAVDEFEHIGISATNEEIEAHMHCAKSFINESKVPWTAFGTYEMLDFLELNDQLSQRDRIIHFPRYLLELDEDITEFKLVLEHLLQRMPLKQTPIVSQQLFELCYMGCIGKIGALINWLIDAYDLCLSENSSTLSLAHLEETIKPEFELTKMLDEAEKGETKLLKNKEKRKAFRIRIGFEGGEKDAPNKANNGTTQQASDSSNKAASTPAGKTSSENTKPKRNRPFKRSPKRDSVGDKPA